MKMLAVVCTWVMLSCPCIARTITVADDGPADFDTIQAAVDYSVDGDEIVVADGRYAREPLRAAPSQYSHKNRLCLV